jgi:hypothetical protein
VHEPLGYIVSTIGLSHGKRPHAMSGKSLQQLEKIR